MGAFIGKQVISLPMTAVGISYSNWVRLPRHESIGIHLDFCKVGTAAGAVTFELRSSEDASPCPLESGGNAISVTVAKSSAFIQGSVGKLTWASVGTQSSGSDVLVKLVGGATAGAETVTVSNTTESYPEGSRVTLRTITIGIQSGVSTAAQIKTAMDANAACAALVSTTVTTSGAMEAADVALSGGSKFVDVQSAASMFRAKLTVTTASVGSFANVYMNGKE
jgi:hypothetical protein